MDFSQFAVLTLIVAGITELINRLRAKDYWVVATIATAAVVGGLIGYFKYYPDLDTLEGITAGFAASGAVTVVGSVGRKSEAKPSKALTR